MTEEKTGSEKTVTQETLEARLKAFNLISTVCANYSGALKEHQAIQHALEILKPV